MAERWTRSGAPSSCLYLDGNLVGSMATPELAAEIVETMNRVGRLIDEVRAELPPAPCGCPVTLASRTRVTRHTRECSGRQAAERIAADIEASSDGNGCDCPAPEPRTDWSRVDPYDTTKGGAVDA